MVLDFTKEEFESKARSDAQRFRTKKVKEILEKTDPTQEEISFIECWAMMFKADRIERRKGKRYYIEHKQDRKRYRKIH